MMENMICPFMSRPVSDGTITNIKFTQCQKEYCMAWGYKSISDNNIGVGIYYCKLIEGELK